MNKSLHFEYFSSTSRSKHHCERCNQTAFDDVVQLPGLKLDAENGASMFRLLFDLDCGDC